MSYIDQVESLLPKRSSKKSKADPYIRLGLSVPKVRSFVKTGLFDDLTQAQRVKAWGQVWKGSQYFEAMSLALYSYQYRSLTQAEWNQVKSWINRCDCWEHSDDLSKIYAQVLEEHPAWVLPVLRQWNKSRNLWKRRQSVVSLLEYARKRKKIQPYKVLIVFVDNLLGDKEYYVQKGVGWTLREIYNVYPHKTLKYIEKNLAFIDPMAYTAATEKLDKTVKNRLNQKRKIQRKKSKV